MTDTPQDTIAEVAEEAALEADAGEARPRRRGKGDSLPRMETVAEKRQAQKKRGGPADLEVAKPGERFILVRGNAYPFPVDFTGRELQMIQQETGVRAGEIEEAAGAGDVTVLCAIAGIALSRNSEPFDLDDLLDLRFGDEDEGIDFLEVPADEGGDRPTGSDAPRRSSGTR